MPLRGGWEVRVELSRGGCEGGSPVGWSLGGEGGGKGRDCCGVSGALVPFAASTNNQSVNVGSKEGLARLQSKID
jgi:hypothetical protein